MTASMAGYSCHTTPSRLQGRMKAPGPCLVSPSLSKRRKFRLGAGAHPLQASMAPLRQCLMPVAAFVMAMHLHAGACSAAEVLIGTPRVIDGDTLEVAGTRVRLFGIDAPEKKQACLDGRGESYLCGQAATSALREVIGDAPVACTVKTKDMYRRSVAVCTVVRPGERPLDLNAWLVEEGHAVAYRRYSKDFVPAELRAQEAKRGIWAGRFELPEGWRHKETMPQWFQ
uniref:TNase-like domain-containing protein n=2 Tax=Auxenochlorella protothecoides TaxID=3075 RepID=A0A1D1ZRL6_AUXPR